MGRYVWALVAKKDNAQMRWIDFIYLHEQSLWDYVPKSGASWYWKKFFATTKDKLKHVLTFDELKAVSTYSVKLFITS